MIEEIVEKHSKQQLALTGKHIGQGSDKVVAKIIFEQKFEGMDEFKINNFLKELMSNYNIITSINNNEITVEGISDNINIIREKIINYTQEFNNKVINTMISDDSMLALQLGLPGTCVFTQNEDLMKDLRQIYFDNKHLENNEVTITEYYPDGSVKTIKN